MRAERRFIAIYGFAHFGKSLFWYTSELLFAYFLTEACGFTPWTMAAILSASLVVNAGADIIIGRALARRVASTATASRTQFFGALVNASAFCLFGCAGLVAPVARIGFALGALLLFRLSYPFFDIPQNAMLSLTTSDDAGRARLSSVRFVFTGVASVAVASLFSPLLQGRHALVQASNFAAISVGLSVVAIASAGALRLLTQVDPDPRLAPAAGGRFTPASTPRSDWELASLFLTLLIVAFTGATFARLEPYLVAFGLKPGGGSGAGSGGLLVAIALGSVAAQPLWAIAVRRTSLATTLRLSALATIVGAAGILLLAHAGIGALDLSGGVYGGGSGGVGMCVWALAAAATGKARWLGSAGSTFGLITGTAKLGSAAAAIAVGQALGGGNFRSLGHWDASLRPVAAGVAIAGAAAAILLSHQFDASRRSVGAVWESRGHDGN